MRLCLLLLAFGCNKPQDLGDLTGTIPDSPAEPVCVWNQAYTENYQADSVAEVLSGAHECYVLLDPFDSTEARDAIPDLKAQGNTVGCYISVGTCEDWRDDFAAIEPYCTSKQWAQWPGEFFVTDPVSILAPMEQRVQKMADWGCDMVEFDNMDFAGESDTYDLNVTETQGDTYTSALCDSVHAAGMGCMAKNYRGSSTDGFDGGTFESSSNQLDWWEHSHMQSFVDQGKPTIVFHYRDRRCDDVTTFYRLGYGSGVSLLCEDPDLRGYRH